MAVIISFSWHNICTMMTKAELFLSNVLLLLHHLLTFNLEQQICKNLILFEWNGNKFLWITSAKATDTSHLVAFIILGTDTHVCMVHTRKRRKKSLCYCCCCCCCFCCWSLLCRIRAKRLSIDFIALRTVWLLKYAQTQKHCVRMLYLQVPSFFLCIAI